MNLIDRRGLGIGLGAAVLACVAVPLLLPAYWVYLAIAAMVSAVIMQSYGVIIGRAGMMSLCQMSFAAIGAWTVLKLNLHDAPGGLVLWLLIGGLAAVPVGVAIGLPALRIRGVNLAVVTLGFAVAADIVLNANQFPGTNELKSVVRPALFSSAKAYFILVVIVFTLIALGLALINRTRLGMSWLELRHSERAAAAHGILVSRSKLAAFAISAFIAGVGGGLMAGQLGMVVSSNFAMMQSLVLFAVAILIGPHHPEGAVLGGIFGAIMPTILEKLRLPQDLGGIMFGIMAVFALRSGVSQTDFTRSRKREKAARALMAEPREPRVWADPPPVETGGEPALAVQNLSVRFGKVVALDGIDITVPKNAVVGLVGPNGAGKSTFISAVSGFVAGYEGTVKLAGSPLEGLSPSVRARKGLRRTFQTTVIAPELTLYEYMTIGAGRRLSKDEADEFLEFFGCPQGDVPVSIVDAGTRRLLDVAAAIAAKPSVALLDEPGAGQSASESLELGIRLAQVPARFGVSVLLVEHDMELVRAACAQVTVLDFGHVIASGPTRDVLEDPVVMAAYLGTADVPVA
jgi:branched-chain amino acid transport system permease protein